MNYTYLDNDLSAWGMALAVALATFFIALLARKLIVRALSSLAARTSTEVDDVLAHVLSSTGKLFFCAVSVYAGAQFLTLPARALTVLNGVVLVAVFAQIALWGDLGVKEWLRRYRVRNRGENAASTTSTAALGFVARAAIWLVVLLMILDNFGVNITTLVASLGIGGIAVALAMQNILGDLFSSLSIVLDKPFVVGDFITVDGVSGTVEYVGLKTTRLQGLGGEQIIFSNSDMLKSRIHNYKRMQTRRIAFTIGVTYQTSAEKIERLPSLIAQIVKRQSDATFDRAHFKSFGASSLDFEIVYFVNSADYGVYMDIQQGINLDLLVAFEREEIEFAYPTQTIFHAGALSLARAANARQEAPEEQHAYERVRAPAGAGRAMAPGR